MTVSQYTDPYISDCYAPVVDELSVADLPVKGEIPIELEGMLVQNSPNPRYAPPGRYHWFDGDGMVHGVRFSNGSASYRNQYVRTRGFNAEESAGGTIWRGLLEPIDPSLGDVPDKDTANTDLVWHNDKLLALWWLSGQPYRIDPNTLKTIGPETFDGTQQCNVASHPKVCPLTGDMVFIDYDVYRPPYLRYGVVSADGKMVHHEVIDVPGPRLFHDIAITENHTVLMDLPMYWVSEAVKAGKRRIWFDPEMPSRFGIIPRFGDNSQVPWFETEACYIYHTIHSWEEGDEVVMTACRIDNPLPTTKYADDPGVPRLYFLRLEPSEPVELPPELSFEDALRCSYMVAPKEFLVMDHLAVVHDFDMTELDSHNIGVLADVIISEEGVVQARGDVLMFDEFCFQFKTMQRRCWTSPEGQR